ncbi:MAG TPA: hypothetical protein VGE67_01460 [Haloferula sp.]
MPDVEEDKPEPDLDELLELFREPEEEKPRRKKTSGSLLMMGAVVLSLVGGWMAAVVANRPVAKHTTLGPPVLPTKVSDRRPREESNVAEDYTTRCQKGMSAVQVRWIVDDFKKEGLDDGPGSYRAIIESILEPLNIADANTQKLLELAISTEPAVKLKTAGLQLALHQQHWYADAMADALRLSAQQKLLLKTSGHQFVRQCESDFLKVEAASVAADAGGPERSYLRDRMYDHLSGTDVLFPGSGLLEPSYWLKRPDSGLLGIVQLSPQQQELLDLRESPGVEVPARLRDLGEVLPLVPGQKFPADANDVVGLAEALHPAQLKVLLLCEPKVATELSTALEKTNE